ncbi:MAG: hypothetical protein AAF934_00625 [Bacteroidota bacterium]
MSTTPTTIAFIQHHQPALDSGEYRVTIDQALDDTGTKISAQHYGLTQTFYVAGERFHILPEHIKSAFPPPHSLGEHSNVLPHLMLSRNTLPWEREAVPGVTTTPWLALLVIHESEAADTTVNTVMLSELKTASTASPWFPGISETEPGQTDAMKIAVLDIKKSLLDQILPDQNALNFLTHIRQGQDSAIPANITGEDLAVLIANRLPQAGAVNTVHLVSLEDRYNAGGTFDHDPGAGNDDLIRLVKLYSWEFTSTEHFKVSETFLAKASNLPQTIINKLLVLKDREFFTETAFSDALTNEAGLTQQELTNYETTIFEDFAYGDFANILHHLDRTTETLRLPDVGDASADSYLQTGFYPLPHRLRGGAQTVSWYHGPLSPQSNTETFTFPAEGSDALLRYYEATGMFDVSYAAAWELGRLLALQNTSFSTELYRWKRRYAKAHLKKDQIANDGTGHLKGGNKDHSPESMPSSVTDWLSELELLKGIPFNYLVPDEELLPAESIRFFQVDALWMRAVLDGAFSIGRVTRNDHALDAVIAASETALTAATSVSGFILRSEVVSGWPGMQIEGYSTTPDSADFGSSEMELLRQERLSNNVLLCLFKKNDEYTGDEDLQTLDLHLKPEVLHFGVKLKDDSSGYEKLLRDTTGAENAAYTVDVGLNNNVIDLTTLLGDIQAIYDANNSAIEWEAPPTSANLAPQLIEGVEKVRFIKAAS